MSPLSTREVCQRLRDAALEVCALQHIAQESGPVQISVEIDGWQLLLDFDGQRLHHCLQCRCPEDRVWRLDTTQRFGTDPVSLLSTWELAQIERLLAQVG
ncbi:MULTISPECIES: hypothetical protein [unclassified Pseudomonas]|uniref:DUF7693 family protein n=1 Tax=unclassified Pseudomonas TaxID=196821 RepID=UPI000C88BAB2|nr:MULTISPECIES: hypothetical protein [unclassified Pseudomonas]PNA03474.1 hypothetical protein C1X28_20975 [Pseudomonas sp. FW305-BF15]PNB78956.1 hypothetical protein C1X30_20835 [Pseudomonas sp. FW305-BF6]